MSESHIKHETISQSTRFTRRYWFFYWKTEYCIISGRDSHEPFLFVESEKDGQIKWNQNVLLEVGLNNPVFPFYQREMKLQCYCYKVKNVKINKTKSSFYVFVCDPWPKTSDCLLLHHKKRIIGNEIELNNHFKSHWMNSSNRIIRVYHRENICKTSTIPQM